MGRFYSLLRNQSKMILYMAGAVGLTGSILASPFFLISPLISQGSSQTAGYIILSMTMILVFVLLLFWLLVRHDFCNGPDILGIRRFRFVCFAVPFLTVALLTIDIVLSSVFLAAQFIFFICLGVDFVLIIGILTSVLVSKVTEEYRRMPLDEDGDDNGSGKLVLSYLRRFGGLPKEFTYKELVAATNNFQTAVGRGGSGSVFKGILRDGLPRDGLRVAVKRIEGGEKQFNSEISAIVTARHANLVTIVGYCPLRHGYRFLVYEFMENGSLDSWIFPVRGDTEKYLKWDTRYQVAINIAKALSYLHLDLRNKILHLDVKPENILLDKNFRASVSDFGISRIMDTDESRVLTRTRGTRGYYAPEWFSKEGITEKSDVYSYGMVLLELLTGQRNLRKFDDRRSWVFFPKIVSEKMREGKLMEVVDERLMKDGSIKEDEVTILVYVALWCIQDRPELRPTMEDVVCMLKGPVTVDMPPETRMYILDYMYSDPDTASVLSRAESYILPQNRDFHSISFSSQSSSESTRSIYFSAELSSADRSQATGVEERDDKDFSQQGVTTTRGNVEEREMIAALERQTASQISDGQ